MERTREVLSEKADNQGAIEWYRILEWAADGRLMDITREVYLQKSRRALLAPGMPGEYRKVIIYDSNGVEASNTPASDEDVCEEPPDLKNATDIQAKILQLNMKASKYKEHTVSVEAQEKM